MIYATLPLGYYLLLFFTFICPAAVLVFSVFRFKKRFFPLMCGVLTFLVAEMAMVRPLQALSALLIQLPFAGLNLRYIVYALIMGAIGGLAHEWNRYFWMGRSAKNGLTFANVSLCGLGSALAELFCLTGFPAFLVLTAADPVNALPGVTYGYYLATTLRSLMLCLIYPALSVITLDAYRSRKKIRVFGGATLHALFIAMLALLDATFTGTSWPSVSWLVLLSLACGMYLHRRSRDYPR